MTRPAWLALLALVAGCGQKGPLFLPGDEASGPVPPVAAGAPDTTADEPGEEDAP